MTENNNGNKNGGGLFTGLIIVIAIIAGVSTWGDSESSRQKQADTLKSGLTKYYSGESMSKDEYNTVKSFNEWKYKNSNHTYDSWENN